MPNLNTILGPVIDGRRMRISDETLARVLWHDYIGNKDQEERRKESRIRLDFYRDRGMQHIDADISEIFKNAKVRKWRKQFVRFSLWQNCTKRIIRETSAVYSESAERGISSNPERYSQLQREMHYDRWMRKVNRFTNLLNETLVRPDVNVHTGEAQLRVDTPDKFWAIAHPADRLTPVGYIVEQFPGADASPSITHYLGIDEETFFSMNKAGHIIDGTRRAHGFGRIPAVLVHREPPDECLLDQSTGRDLSSAHRTIAMLIVMMLKHQKSGTKMGYISGDTSSMPTGQPMDEEHLVNLPEGVSASTLDLGSDPKNYIDAIREVLKQIAANYGIPASVYDLTYQATSGFEINLKRIGLREVRRDQIIDYRPIERDIAEILALVLKRANNPLKYSMDGWSINFGELEAPTDPLKTLELWVRLEKLHLIDRVQMYRNLNPEATLEEAVKVIDANRDRQIERIRYMQGSNPGLFGPSDSANQPNDKDTSDITRAA